MLSQRIRRFTFVAIALALWLGSVAYRNRDNPQVRCLTWEVDGQMCAVEFELWNPKDRPVNVKAEMRMVSPGGEESGLGPSIGRETEIFYRIGANSHIKVQEEIRYLPTGKPEVRVFLVAEADRHMSARNSSANNASIAHAMLSSDP